jgi:hypothetical protein
MNRLPTPEPPASKSRASRGNVLTPDPGRALRREKWNMAEFNRACDAFLLARVSGYRLMNQGGKLKS